MLRWAAECSYLRLLCALLQVQAHAHTLHLTLPCNAEGQRQLALKLSRTLLRPRRLIIYAAEWPCLIDVGEALSIPELAPTLSVVKEVKFAGLPCSLNLAAVSGPAVCPAPIFLRIFLALTRPMPCPFALPAGMCPSHASADYSLCENGPADN
jgi:hypothetical protein